MKDFTVHEIQRQRNLFSKCKYENIETELGNRKFDYFILPQALNPEFENFVMRMTNEQTAKYIFGVSDNLRKDFRDYFIFHEYVEFIESTPDSQDKCILSLKKELKLVPKEIIKEYAGIRKKFFKDLVDYSQKHPDFYTQSDISQFKKNILTLDEFLR